MRQVRPFARLVVCTVLFTLVPGAGCRRAPRVSEETYRHAVTAFYVSLAAMQTSQDLHARKELDRFVQLAPDEPAGWANLGLLLLRQQQFPEAIARLGRASALAPRNAAIERLLALAESRNGNVDRSIGHWRRALTLDVADLQAPFALAQELQRLGGDANHAEAQRVLDALATRSGNLAAQLELARLAARRGDGATLDKVLQALDGRSQTWPAGARERFNAVRDAARASAAGATTPVIFLKNVLIRDPEYRAAFAAVTTPQEAIGEPLLRFVALPNPEPQPAAPDEQLTFWVDATPPVASPGASWAGAVWLTGDGRPTVLAFAGPGLDGVAPADLNYDFRTDVVVAGTAGLEILRQTDKGTLTSVTTQTKLPASITGAPVHGIWPADTDTDGDLDLVVALRDGPATVLRNNSDGTFAAQSPFGAVLRLRSFAWADLDGEGVPDAALLDDQGVLRIFTNLRGSEFQERGVPSSFPRVAGIAAADQDGDGILDIVAVAGDGAVVRLSQEAGRSDLAVERVARAAFPAPLAPGEVRLLAADLDNNAAADVVISTRAAARVLLAGSDGTLRPIESGALPGGITTAADLDGDGRLELVGRTDAGARVVRVKGTKAYRWQAVRPRAMTAFGDQRINSFGVGGEVEVRTGLHVQKQAIAAPVVHFGLGQAAVAEVARITWPNGILQSEFDLAADTSIGATQRLKGSCPWLFAWNGREMAFVTDFIWRSPLGLRINAQATANVQMTEEWVRIRGDQLQPRAGAYDVRVTAELWESHFLDLVSLLVVDHPEGTEVFVDERFAVPPPRLGVMATSPVQPFARVHDDQGRDVAAVVGARDDRHLDSAGRGRYQGVTRDHHIEMELPEDAPPSGPLWLIGHGWVHPTDSSINVALGQGTHPRPTGLSLHVADRAGRFKPARTDLGFPAGKDKTVLIDLQGLFPPTGPRKLRLSTNLEIFWDRLGWAAGRPDVKLEPRRLDLKTADLRFRGYSVTEQKDASTPERARYVVEGVAPRWRDLEGWHTRFGDVRELLQAVDDRYVIMNAGDELRLAYPEAPPPAPGMVRDFVLVGDGWEKDGDYNTVASRTVLPLPTHRSPQYVRRSGRLEDDPVYRRHPADFERYHTRFVSPEPIRDALRAKIASRRP